MALSERDRDNITVHSLIGYCQSAKILTESPHRDLQLKNWAEGLIEIANALDKKLSK